MASDGPLRVESYRSEWQLAGVGAENFQLINEFLGYLADRAYSPQTVRAYAFDLLALARWLLDQHIVLEEITTDVLLRFLTACRTAPRSIDDWPRFRRCSHTARCVNRNYPTPSRAGVRLDVPPEVSALDCSAISPSPGRGRVCGCGSHAACPVACNQAKHKPC